MADSPARSRRNPRMAAYRARLRAAGLRPITLWVPDTRAPGFAAEIQAQSLALRDSPGEAEALDFIEAIADDPRTDAAR